jgi:hypothetical protein
MEKIYETYLMDDLALIGSRAESAVKHDMIPIFREPQLWNITLPWIRVLTSSMSTFQTSCEHVPVALTVSTFCACHVLSSDRSDHLASPSEKKNLELPLPSSSFYCDTSATALCRLKTTRRGVLPRSFR